MGAAEGMGPNFAPTFVGQVELLERVRLEGNKLFAERNLGAAVVRYSQCIDLASIQPNPNAVDNNAAAVSAQTDDFNRVVVLAFSNRAEARLRLKAYTQALQDVESALQIDPKHVKTLVRKGKAYHALQQYQKACEAFQCVLDESPEEQSIQDALKASKVAVKQSRRGRYDLADFFKRDCQPPIPSCADFVGPVEIRRKASTDGRARGLFATKSLEPGELLIVSNPLAAGRQKPKSGAFKVKTAEFPEELFEELVTGIRGSNVQSVRFCYLASDDIPSMDLFRPGSESIQPHAVPEGRALDVNFVHDVASRNMFHFNEITGKPRGTSEVAGLWVLPAFAKHSCAPNCHHSLVGETLFYRAARHIKEGEELTILYFSGAYNYVTYRRSCSENWRFKCKCKRCLYEEKLLPQLGKIHERMEDKQQRGFGITGEHGAVDPVHEFPDVEFSSLCDEVEDVIKSLGRNISSKQKNWIRASFLPLYMAKMVNAEIFWIYLLRFVVESQASVSVTHKVLEEAAWLFTLVEAGSPSKDCKDYRETLEQVKIIYSIYYGKLPDALLHTLISLNTPDFT